MLKVETPPLGLPVGPFYVVGTEKKYRQSNLLDLPQELVDLLVNRLGQDSLAALACVCKYFDAKTKTHPRWKALYEERWGASNALTELAAELGSGWKQLCASKDAVKESAGRPAALEVQAAVKCITSQKTAEGVAVVALIDGSGSMAEGDFARMTSVVSAVSDALSGDESAQVGVVQFSGRTQVELPLSIVTGDSCSSVLKRVTRMNGGTNIGLAIEKGGDMMSHLPADVSRVIVVLSDFRVDQWANIEAIEAAARVAKEQPNTSFFAFGVGRFVDMALVHSLLTMGSNDSPVAQFLSLGWEEDLHEEDC